MDKLIIRRMTAADVETVSAIEKATFSRPWSAESFRREVEQNVAARYLVAEKDGRVIGYAGAWVVLDECHITNIAVAEAERGQGYGRQLVQALMQYASNLGAAWADLEVRVSNTRAQHLYVDAGFVSVGKRKRYYEDNGEDAFLMVCEHMPAAMPDFEETPHPASEGAKAETIRLQDDPPAEEADRNDQQGKETEGRSGRRLPGAGRIAALLLALLFGWNMARSETAEEMTSGQIIAETAETMSGTAQDGGSADGDDPASAVFSGERSEAEASSGSQDEEIPGVAKNITASCVLKLCTTPWNDTMITDGKYTSYWDSKKINAPWVNIHSDEPMYGLYLCFRRLPESFEIQVPGPAGENEERTWIPLMRGDTRFHHTFYALEGIHDLRIQSTQDGMHKMGFNEIFVFGKGEIPDWVQRWEPTEEKADILFFSAHPDDELLFYGGAIPTYAAEKGKRVVVAYLSYSNTTRRSETLNGLWAMGVRHYPEFGGFQDAYSNKLSAAYTKLGKQKVLHWVTEMYRKHQPDVVVTQDINGEYGHGQHRMIADAAIRCYESAADPAYDSESLAKYGTWQAKKLYVHLWGNESNQTRFDWDVPLESMGGKTGRELAKEAYALHVTQTYAKVKINGKWHLLSIDETGTVFSSTTFGLYASQVGPDRTHTDFLENID